MYEPTAQMISFQKSLEGLKLKPYICPSGKPTIGYGTTFYPATGVAVTMQDTAITEKLAEEYLIHDLKVRGNEILELLTWQVPPNVLEALVSLSRNIGMERFATSTCLKILNSGKGSAEERIKNAAVALTLFNKAKNPKTGKLEVLGGLTSRRADEEDIMVNGWDATSSNTATISSIVENSPSVLKSDRGRWAIFGLVSMALPAVMSALPALLIENNITLDGSTPVSWVSWAGMGLGLLMVLLRTFAANSKGNFGSQARPGS